MSQAIAAPEIFEDSSQSALSPTDMRKVVEQTKFAVLLSPKVIHDPILKAYIQELGMKLVKYTDKPSQYPYTFFLIKQDDINAFATLGNYVGVHSGLFLTTQSESELAAVLAHEISHCQQQHLLHIIQHSQDMKLPMILGMLGALGLSVISPNLGQGLLVAGAAGMQQDMLNYTRSFEREADQIGIHLLHKTHFSVNAMPKFFQRMQQNERYYDNPTTPFLRTHPVTTARIAESKNYAARFQHKKVTESIDYQFMRERLRFIHNDNLKQLADYYQIKLKKDPQNDALYYGAAITYNELGLTQRALETIKKMPHHQNYWLSQLLRSQALANQNPKAGLPLMQKLYQAHPDSYPIIVNYVEQLKNAGLAKKAVRVARFGLISRRQDPHMWWVLSEAENKAGHKAQAYFAAAHVQALLNKKPRAVKYLQLAKKLGKKDPDLQEQINVKLKEWRKKS